MVRRYDSSRRKQAAELTRKKIVDAALNVNSEHVRIHLAWAAQDAMGSANAAKGAFKKYASKKKQARPASA